MTSSRGCTGEKEFLWPPFSFLEPAAASTVRVHETGGVITVVRARMCSNLKTLKVEELLSQKKDAYLASARYSVEQLSRKLSDMATGLKVQEKLSQDPHRILKGTTYTVEMLVAKLVERVRAVLQTQEATLSEDFLVDSTFRSLSMDFLDAQAHAVSSIRHYAEDSSLRINVSYATPLLWSHRYYVAFLKNALANLSDGDRRAAAAQHLCRVMGLIAESAHEKTAQGELRIIKAALDDDESALRLLLACGVDVNTVIRTMAGHP